jgi:hypothetical protein
MKHMAAIRTKRTSGSQKLITAAWYIGVSIVWLGAVALSLAVDNSDTAARFHLSSFQVRLVQLVFALPGLLIILAILFGGLSIWRYAHSIGNSKEGKGFQCIAYGVFALLAGLVISNYLGGLQLLIAQHAANPQKVKTTFVIINNYVSVGISFITYGMLLKGSHLLLRSINKRLDAIKRLLPVLALFVLLGIVYVWLIHGNPNSKVAASPGVNPAFGLSYWLIVFTVALPLVASWFVGTVALLHLRRYYIDTKGIVYKLLFKKFVVGITLFIFLNIALQLLTQLSSFYATRNVSAILALIVVVYGALAYAFMLIAQGAQKLNSIENILIE